MEPIQNESEKDKLCNKFLFEILERYIRLYNHIEKSIRIASRPGARLTAQLTISNEAQQLLKNEITKILQENYQQKNTNQMLEQFKEALNFLADIHQKVLIAVCKTAWKNGQGIRENSVENCPP